MKVVLLLLSLLVMACSEKKSPDQTDMKEETKTEITMSDSTNHAIDTELDEVDKLLKEIE